MANIISLTFQCDYHHTVRAEVTSLPLAENSDSAIPRAKSFLLVPSVNEKYLLVTAVYTPCWLQQLK
jgi:hypothetical protein